MKKREMKQRIRNLERKVDSRTCALETRIKRLEQADCEIEGTANYEARSLTRLYERVGRLEAKAKALPAGTDSCNNVHWTYTESNAGSSNVG